VIGLIAGRLRGTRLCLAIGVAAAIPIVAPIAASAAHSSPAAVERGLCGSGYVSANLPWGHKCLRAGEFCKVGNRAYLRYGFYCPPSGHLRRR
jgi:hypothetical protein